MVLVRLEMLVTVIQILHSKKKMLLNKIELANYFVQEEYYPDKVVENISTNNYRLK